MIIKNVVIEKMDYEARGICFIDKKITFVNNALVGEVVDIEIIESKKNFNIANIINIIEKSKNRIEPVCKYYDLCGGCDLLHQECSKNTEYKEEKVLEVLSRKLNLDNVVKNKIQTNTKYNYRNKVTLHVSNNKLGFYKKNTKDIIDIDYCHIADNKINEMITWIRNNINLENIKEIALRSSTMDNIMVIIDFVKIDNDVINKFKDNEQVHTVVSIFNKNLEVYKNSFFYEKIGASIFEISHNSFFQVNTNMIKPLYDSVKKHIETNESILDLFCGTGTIGIYVTDESNKLMGIDINKNAIRNAKKNATLNTKEASFICADLDRYIYEVEGKFDTVILDPPRKGLSNKLLNQVMKIDANKIIYVSCNPITLAKDLEILSENYKLEEIDTVDMFFGTHHVETVVLLCRK